ncbi:MAG: lipocalin-like domain-containing protein [Polyangiaceae bacterium]
MGTDDLLVGAWELEVCEARGDDGPPLLPLGDNPRGILLYSADYAMSVTIMRAGRTPFAASDILKGTEREKAHAAETYLSYAGRWTLAGDRVRHTIEVSLFPNWVGTVQERRVKLDGGWLELSTDPIVFGGQTRIARMTWRRVKGAGRAT